ncbi:MAG: glycosyltransferase [Cytophagales bacterium]|nr:glycosyltransferase [Cytophagales bacterium]MDW8383760.1 glycosyltransferase [Flammeovirgaceae bacterium]
MKIAYLSTFYPYRGGIAHFNALLYRAFEQQSNTIKAFTFTRQYPEILFPGSTQYVSSADKVDNIPAVRVLDTINPITYFSTAHQIQKFKPDILVMKYWMPFFAPSLGTVARLLRKKGVKTAAILDNVKPHEKRIGDNLLNRYFLSSLDFAVVMSPTVEQDLKDLSPSLPYVFHPHPTYNHFGQKLPKSQAREYFNIPNHAKVLLFFGLIRAYKGLDVLIESFNRLSEEYYLLIAGEPYEDTQKYRALVAQNKNRERIFIYEKYIPDNEVNLFFSAADVNILPYKSATQSGVLTISYHFDLPVIVTKVGSLHDTVEKYRTGITIQHADVPHLVEAITSFFHSSYSYEENISNFKKVYTWESLAAQIVEHAKTIR